jgi:hypothetical protein
MILSYFHTNLIFLGEGGAYLSAARYMTPCWGEAPSLAAKYKTSVEVSDSDKHSRLPRYGINYAVNILLPCSQFEGYHDTQHKDTQHEDIQHGDTQHKDTQHKDNHNIDTTWTYSANKHSA